VGISVYRQYSRDMTLYEIEADAERLLSGFLGDDLDRLLMAGDRRSPASAERRVSVSSGRPVGVSQRQLMADCGLAAGLTLPHAQGAIPFPLPRSIDGYVGTHPLRGRAARDR
jgi:hypothetical protein